MNRKLSGITLGLVAFTICVSEQKVLAQTGTQDPAMKLASIEIEHQIVSAGLMGKPVLVSRSDVESSTARARSVQIIDGPNLPQSPVADPAFKTVLLTPRGSTGRPVQLDLGAIPQSLEPPVAKEPPPPPPAAAAPAVPATVPASSVATAPASSEPKAPASPPSAAPKSPVPTVAKLAPGAVKKQVSSPPSTRPAPSVRAPQSTRQSPKSEPNYGAAEIAASRAFTRF